MSPSSPRPLGGSPLGESKAATSRLVREMFGSIAPRYDFLNHFLSAGMDVAWRRSTAKASIASSPNSGLVALDLCCGTGDLTFALAQVCGPSARIFGVDFCQPMVALAQSKLVEIRGLPCQAAFACADALNLPLQPGSIDLITTGFGFRNLADYKLALAEIRRVLKPGGRLTILEFSRVQWPVFGPLFRFYFRRILPRLGTWISGVSGPYQYLHDSASRFPDQEAFAALLRDAGFADVRYRNFMGGVAALHSAQKP